MLSGVPPGSQPPGLHTGPARWPVLPTELLERLLVRGCHRNTHCKDTQSPPGLRSRDKRAEENKQERADSGGERNLSVNQRKYKHTHVGTQIRNSVPWMYKKGAQIMFLFLKLLWQVSFNSKNQFLLELSQHSWHPLSQDHYNRESSKTGKPTKKHSTVKHNTQTEQVSNQENKQRPERAWPDHPDTVAARPSSLPLTHSLMVLSVPFGPSWRNSHFSWMAPNENTVSWQNMGKFSKDISVQMPCCLPKQSFLLIFSLITTWVQSCHSQRTGLVSCILSSLGRETGMYLDHNCWAQGHWDTENTRTPQTE